MGVEVVAVPADASPEAIRDLSSSPPVLFPVVTDGALGIVETYRMFAPGSHAELLIDRQGYLRAIWRGDTGAMPEATALMRQPTRAECGRPWRNTATASSTPGPQNQLTLTTYSIHGSP